MTKYKYNVEYSNSFKKNLKKIIKQGKDIDKMLDIIDKLAEKEQLEPKHKDHNLINDKYFEDCRECHIEPDWLLIYKYIDDKLILLLMKTGSHSELFKK